MIDKRTTFPELLDYTAKSFYDETSRENHTFSQEDLDKCVMTKDVQGLVDKNICECGGSLEVHKLREIGLGMTICKRCGNCGRIYLVEVKLENSN